MRRVTWQREDASHLSCHSSHLRVWVACGGLSLLRLALQKRLVRLGGMREEPLRPREGEPDGGAARTLTADGGGAHHLADVASPPWTRGGEGRGEVGAVRWVR